MSQIRCVVRECVYNNQHGFCQAGSIRIRSSNENGYVQTSDNTACGTFMPGGNAEISTINNFEDGNITSGGEYQGDFVEFVQNANSIFSH